MWRRVDSGDVFKLLFEFEFADSTASSIARLRRSL